MDSSSCDFDDVDSLFPTSGQRDIDLLNDSDFTVHLLVPGEARSPSNLVLPGSGRVATVRATPSESLTVRAENSDGFFGFGGCTFVEEIASQGGTVSFTGTTFICEGSLFE